MNSLRGEVDGRTMSAGTWDKEKKVPKVELCRMFRNTGKCSYGNNCRFLHQSPEQLEHTSIDEAIMVHSGDRRNESGQLDSRSVRSDPYQGISPIPSKKNPCGYWLRFGNCTRGERCKFAHEDNQVPVGLVRSQLYQGNSTRSWKTGLCYFWLNFGNCKRGKQCKFAHGEQELTRPGTGNASDSRINQTTDKAGTSSSRPDAESAENLPFKGKCKIKRWDIGYISRIYADWIENEAPADDAAK